MIPVLAMNYAAGFRFISRHSLSPKAYYSVSDIRKLLGQPVHEMIILSGYREHPDLAHEDGSRLLLRILDMWNTQVHYMDPDIEYDFSSADSPIQSSYIDQPGVHHD